MVGSDEVFRLIARQIELWLVIEQYMKPRKLLKDAEALRYYADMLQTLSLNDEAVKKGKTAIYDTIEDFLNFLGIDEDEESMIIKMVKSLDDVGLRDLATMLVPLLKRVASEIQGWADLSAYNES